MLSIIISPAGSEQAPKTATVSNTIGLAEVMHLEAPDSELSLLISNAFLVFLRNHSHVPERRLLTGNLPAVSGSALRCKFPDRIQPDSGSRRGARAATTTGPDGSADCMS
jgi:trans-aconitate methyltransferase